MTVVSRIRRHLRMAGVLLMLGLGLVACDGGGDSGPGELVVQISSPIPLSAAVVQIAGEGITGARALGGEQVASAQSGETGTPGRRVVVFRDAPGPVRFALEVDDVGRSFTATVLDAADSDGEPVSGAGGLEVSISR